jgi:hypothetical protein
MYELFQQYGAGGHIPRLSDVGGIRDRYVALLRVWNEVYFGGVDVGILTGLANEAAAKRELLSKADPVMVVEAATNGMWLEPIDVPKRIVLIPQHHMRPWNTIGESGGISTFHYAADVLPLAEGELPPALNRLTRALDDANRLYPVYFGACAHTAPAEDALVAVDLDEGIGIVHGIPMLLAAGERVAFHIVLVGQVL